LYFRTKHASSITTTIILIPYPNPIRNSLCSSQLLDEIVRNAPESETIVVPLVSRHIDFLASLSTANPSPLPPTIKESLSRSILLLGSAPVGPTTIKNLQDFAGTLPTVRFGSTETTLQVLGTPRGTTTVAEFKAGWEHEYEGNPSPGYYIGRPHEGCTKVRVVNR